MTRLRKLGSGALLGPAAFALALLLNAALSPAAETPLFALGNGSLTLGLDAAGNWISCRWPSPGTPDHLAGVTQVPAGNWGILIDDAWQWPGQVDTDWRAIPVASPSLGLWQTVLVSADGKNKLDLQAAVHPIRDIAVFRATSSGANAVTELAWRGRFRPLDRTVTGIAGLAETLARDAAGVAWNLSAAEGPPDALRWQSPAGSDSLPPVSAGMFFGLAAIPPAEIGSPDEVPAGVSAETLRLTTRAVEGGQAVDVYLAVARSEDQLRLRLQEAMALGFDRLTAETTAYWQARAATLPNTRPGLPEALHHLQVATDRSSGAVVDAALGDPHQGVVSSRTTAWAAWAYDLAGDGHAASRAIQFLARAVVREARPGIPAGMLPSRLYTDGRPATPYARCDIEGLCWFLGACARHAAQQDDVTRPPFLESVDDAVSEAANLLADWTLGPNGPPLPSYQPALGTDGESMQTLLLMLSGLQAATAVRVMRDGVPNPDWVYRFDALLARALLTRQEGNAPIPMDPLVAYWLRTGLLSSDAPRLSGLSAMQVAVDGVTMRLDEVPCPALTSENEMAYGTLAAACNVVCAEAAP